MSIEKFKKWMGESTAGEKKELAIKARTSLSLLYQLVYGTRNASSELAGRIEQGVKSINRRKRHSPLPVVQRGDLCETCSKCKFYKECDK